MYVRRNELSERERFPVNYNGSLLKSTQISEQDYDTKPHHSAKYTVKRNKLLPLHKESPPVTITDNDELILIGALAFLYIGCEHSKDNLILMAILAYLLFFGKK